MVRALVTGATGCVGANVVEVLLARGYTVRALRRRTSRLDALRGLDVDLCVGDVRDPASLRSAMSSCDLVFHAAAISQYWRNGPSLLYVVNVTGTRRVLAAALDCGVERVVLTSSVAALGLPRKGHPVLDETAGFNTMPGRFHYGHSKLLAEAEAARAVDAGLDVVCVNPSTVIGRRDINFVGGELLRAVQRGWFVAVPPGGMGVVSASAVGVGHVLAAERGRAGERYILNGENIKHRALVELVAAIVGGSPPLVELPATPMMLVAALARLGCRSLGLPVPGVVTQVDMSARNMYYDGSKAEQELDAPRSDAASAVREAWNWYRAEGLLQGRGTCT